MKIGDRDNFLQTETVELFDGVMVTINGLPFGFQEQMENELPSPEPPRRPKKNVDGEVIYKDKRKKTVKTEPDRDDPKYKKEAQAQTWLQMAWTVYHGTKHDSKLKWSATPEKFKTHEKFYRAIADEMKDAELALGHVINLAKAVLKLSGLTKEQLEAAEETFLSMEGSET